jgi:lysophospholipase L1-like esterase
MEFRTIVDIPKPDFRIEPCEEMFFVGSCFADAIGQRFKEEGFPVTINPYGTMYNPASVLHTIKKYEGQPHTAFITLGTNHVYRLKETGEIVDNCEKRPQSLFQEEELSVDACADYLKRAIAILRQHNPNVRIVLTVSPIRYRKYGYHESQLSKGILLLAIEKVRNSPCKSVAYFPSYEIVLDELRDYRFYAPDMLHPSEQAVDYIWERLVENYFSSEAKTFLNEWRPLKQALAHKPFNPDSEEYRAFMEKTLLKVEELRKKYPTFDYVEGTCVQKKQK